MRYGLEWKGCVDDEGPGIEPPPAEDFFWNFCILLIWNQSYLLLDMDFCVAFLFIGPSEFPTAHLATKWLFARVRSNVSGQMVGARERAHANSTLKTEITSGQRREEESEKSASISFRVVLLDKTHLKWLLPSVNANMTGKLIGSTETSVTVVDWAFVGPVLERRLRWPIEWTANSRSRLVRIASSWRNWGGKKIPIVKIAVIKIV